MTAARMTTNGSIHAAALSVFVGLVGLAPHVYFSFAIGELSFFKSAFDEDTYYSILFHHGLIAQNRLLSALSLRSLARVTGGNPELTMAVADFILPALGTLCAFLLAAKIFSSTAARVALTLSLLFSQELLSLGSSTVWNFGLWGVRPNIALFSSLFGGLRGGFVPDTSTSYFSLFRTPEPQASWILLFILLLLVFDLVETNAATRLRPRTFVSLVAANGMLAFAYVFVSISILILEIAVFLALLLRGRTRIASCLGWGIVAALASFFFAYAAWPESLRASAGTSVFGSRLPSVTPAVMLALASLVFMMLVRGATAWDSHRKLLGLVCLCLPVLLMNQQLVTGLMVSTRDWERYVNYQFVVLGWGLTWLPFANPRQRLALMARWGLPALLVFLLLRGQVATYGSYLEVNRSSHIHVKLLSGVDPSLRRTHEVLLDDPGLAPLIALRLPETSFVITYTDLFLHPIRSMEDAQPSGARAGTYQAKLFQYFAREEKTPEEVYELLRREAEAGAGFYMAFLYSFKDAWYPATDSRRVKQDRILGELPKIRSEYQTYLDGLRCGSLAPAIRVSKRAPGGIGGHASRWSHTPLGSVTEIGPSGIRAMHAYLQALRCKEK